MNVSRLIYNIIVSAPDGADLGPAAEWFAAHPDVAVGEWQYGADHGRQASARPIYAGVDDDDDFVGEPIAYQQRLISAPD